MIKNFDDCTFILLQDISKKDQQYLILASTIRSKIKTLNIGKKLFYEKKNMLELELKLMIICL